MAKKMSSSRKKSKTTNSRVKVVSNTRQSSFAKLFKSRWTAAVMVVAFVAVGFGTLLWAKAATSTHSLWTTASVPKTISESDSRSVELGVKFKSAYAAQVIGMRFYKGPQNTGTHTGSLWTRDGRKLANLTFTNETAGGWQTANFEQPVDIAANTVYIVSYHAPNGYYSADSSYFTTAYKNDPLTAPKNAGVYKYGTETAFPNKSYRSSNYWVDPIVSISRFFPTEKPAAPTNLQATSLDGGVNLTWTPSTSIGIANYVVVRDGNATATLDASASGYKDTNVTVDTSYTYQVKAVDVNGVSSDLSNSVTVTVLPPPTTPPEPTPTPTDPDPGPIPTTWPGPSNTGHTRAPDYPGQLTRYSPTANGTECSGPITSGKTYRFCDFVSPGGGYPSLAIGNTTSFVENVTFYGCRFLGNAVENANITFANGNNIVFDYATIAPLDVTSPPVAYGKGYQYGIKQVQDDRSTNYLHGWGFTLSHSDMWGFGNGIELGRVSQDRPVIVKDTWFHDASADGGDIYHTDAILSSDGSGIQYLTVDHNTIASPGNTNGLALQYESTAYSNITVTNNYFSGFGYTVNIGGSGASKNQNVVFMNNTFGTDFKPVWGPLYSWGDGNGNVWRNNKWRVAPGGYYTATEDDGKYWWPNGTLSTTDYTP